jgi:hypothetical protein
MPIFQPIGDVLCFCSFSTDGEKKMLYTRYNFDFVKYNLAYNVVPSI